MKDAIDKCPYCGAPIRATDKNSSYKCLYCDSEFHLKKRDDEVTKSRHNVFRALFENEESVRLITGGIIMTMFFIVIIIMMLYQFFGR